MSKMSKMCKIDDILKALDIMMRDTKNMYFLEEVHEIFLQLEKPNTYYDSKKLFSIMNSFEHSASFQDENKDHQYILDIKKKLQPKKSIKL